MKPLNRFLKNDTLVYEKANAVDLYYIRYIFFATYIINVLRRKFLEERKYLTLFDFSRTTAGKKNNKAQTNPILIFT